MGLTFDKKFAQDMSNFEDLPGVARGDGST